MVFTFCFPGFLPLGYGRLALKICRFGCLIRFVVLVIFKRFCSFLFRSAMPISPSPYRLKEHGFWSLQWPARKPQPERSEGPGEDWAKRTIERSKSWATVVKR